MEAVFVLVLLAILSSVGLFMFQGTRESAQFEATRNQLETLRKAILGDGMSLDADSDAGITALFGYVGDIGSLPTVLNDLVVKPVAYPGWGFDSVSGIGFGWRGPYVSTSFSSSIPVDKDAWGRNLVYDTASSPATITSYGADGVIGGTGNAQDLVALLPEYRADIYGFVLRGDSKLPSYTVEIKYPSAGTLTNASAITDATGAFSFAAIPWGIRSLQVVTAPGLGPKVFRVDRARVVVSDSLLNFYSGTVTYVANSAATFGDGNKRVLATLSSTHDVNRQLDAVTINWNGGGTLNLWRVNGEAQSLAAIPSGTRFVISRSQLLPANSASNVISMDFSQPMGNKSLTVLLEYSGTTQNDTITFVTP